MRSFTDKTMAEPPEAFVGIVLADRYELSSVLGAGQGGMVFKARHRQLDRFVAVKLLSPENIADKTAFMRFEREAHSIGRLNHPNIVTIFDLGRWRNERPFLVMDYIEGQDLQDIIGKDGRMRLDRCVRIASQVCSALAHAHKRGVIHRDLKPRNIMVINDDDLSDFVKLVDFGIAKDSGADQFNEALTLEGFVVGTPQYMSPEQCKGEKVDGRTDVYALAGVLYKMITGANAISGDSIGEIMNNQIHLDPLPFEKACPQVQIPEEIQQVIFKALSKNREQRHETISQFRQELNEAFKMNSSQSLAASAGFAQQPANATANNLDPLRERAVSGDLLAQYELVLKLEYGQGCKANPEEAKRWLLNAAKKGLKEAQFRLGDHLLRGEAGFDRNAEEAVPWLMRSAEQGYDSAQFALGWCYEKGLGTSIDLVQAARAYQKAAKQGNTQATLQLKICLEQLGTIEAPPAGELADSSSNDPEELFTLGCKIRDSGKRADDRNKAKALFKKASRLGHDIAQHAFIELCLSDPQNLDELADAVNWLEKSTAQGDERAKLLFAACLRNGIGCDRDPQRALALLETLSQAKNLLAEAIIGASMLIGDGIPRNIPRGIALLKHAAENGEAYAQWKLAICYRTGLGVAKDQKAMEMFFQKSSDQYFPLEIDELCNPAGLHFAEAVPIFKMLCSTGNKLAFYWLGICFEYGRGVPRDLTQALSNYEQAKLKGVSAGQKAIERIKANA